MKKRILNISEREWQCRSGAVAAVTAAASIAVRNLNQAIITGCTRTNTFRVIVILPSFPLVFFFVGAIFQYAVCVCVCPLPLT